MPNAFDPYREALVIEHTTIMPEIAMSGLENLAAILHADPARATELSYIRLHTGFRRQITITMEDLERWQKNSSQ
jgi:hypothetical protein